MPRFDVIRESTRATQSEPFSETGWWVLDEQGELIYDSLLDTQQAQRDANLGDTRALGWSDAQIFDYLDAQGGDGYFRLLSLPETRQAASRDALVESLKRAQNAPKL